MHKAGWVHRDVSSGNIALGDKRARLIDFEFAKRASDEDDLTIVRNIRHPRCHCSILRP